MEVINAVSNSESLKLQFPITSSDLKVSAERFQNKSSGGIIGGCVGAIDGWLCSIRTPRADEVGRVKSFFSGHYQTYGINVQACCDSECRFLAFSANSPGGRSDSLAFLYWRLRLIVDQLPVGQFIIGDNAYINTDKLLTPFCKADLINHIDRSNYNFYLSQLRIRIEMSFALLTNKWGIFKKPLAVAFDICPEIIHTCMILHNFCINEKLLASLE